MNPVFAASRSMGHSVILARKGDESEARKALSAAGRNFGRAGLRDAQRVTRRLGANPQAGLIAQGFHNEIQADLEQNNVKFYHAASSGWCFGLAHYGSSRITKNDDFAIAKREIGEWLVHARAHTDALRVRKLVPGMPDFTGKCGNCQTCVHVISDPRKWKEFHSCGSLIKSVGDLVGNAIR